MEQSIGAVDGRGVTVGMEEREECLEFGLLHGCIRNRNREEPGENGKW